MIFALVFFVALFMLVPLVVARGVERLAGENRRSSSTWSTGSVRVGLFVGYIWVIGRSKEIRRVFPTTAPSTRPSTPTRRATR